MKKLFFILLPLLFLLLPCYAQQKNELTPLVAKDSVLLKPYTIDPLSPAKAAFRSAVLPGLGQAYNKSYWKIPIIYGGMATTLYFYSNNQSEYKRFRNAYKDKIAGRPVTGQLANIDPDRLIRAQRTLQRNRDLSLLLTVGIYILNIVEANVDAHLKQFNVNENLTLSPQLQQNGINNKHNLGFSLSYNF